MGEMEGRPARRLKRGDSPESEILPNFLSSAVMKVLVTIFPFNKLVDCKGAEGKF